MTSNCTSVHDRRAFTLMEVMLALAVTAIVLVAINAVFFTAMHLRESATYAVEESLPIEQTLSTLRRDLEGAMAPATDGILSGDFKVGDVSSVGLNQPVDIELYTTTGALHENEPWSEVQKVTYELRPSGDRSVPGNDLIRSVTRNLLATVTPQPDDRWMMGGVQSIEFSCYDGSQWRTYWDTTSTDTNLPSAVRVTLRLAGDNSSRTIQTVVLIDSQTRTNQANADTTADTSGGF